MELQGFKELESLLSTLPSKIENKVLQSATRGAISIAKPDIAAAAPRSTESVSTSSLDGISERSIASRTYGQLHTNIKVENKRKGKSKGSRGAAITTGDSFWGFFLEFGTRYIPAKPWFEPAFRKNNVRMLEELKRRLAIGIDREAKKL